MSKPFRFAIQSYEAESPAQWRDLAKAAEDAGYSTLQLADHYIGAGPALTEARHPVQNIASIPAMAVAAEATDTLRIGCKVFCCDYHQPVVLAKELACLDWFSDGRLEIGLGAGWVEAEYGAMGIEFKPAGRRIDRLEETIALLRASFSEGDVDIKGDHIQATGYEAVPKTVQQPSPPIMIGGGSKRILGIAGRDADIAAINFDNREGKIGAVGLGSGTPERTAEKAQWIRDGAGDRIDDIEIEISGYFTFVTDDRKAGLDGIGSRFGIDPEFFENHQHALVGSVDYCCEELERRREEYGINYFSVGWRQLEAFAPVVERLTGK